ncbi:methyltransferase domain-containing protein [Candidatus Saganbacteria bacterium]|nr:methyltransferase domain-containing protein [Candidatus Saganbacteria bacterium]
MIRIRNEISDRIKNGTIKRVRREKCPLCCGQKFVLIAKKDRLGLPLETLICDICGLVFSGSFFSASGEDLYYSNYCNLLKNIGRSPDQMFAARTGTDSYAWKRYRWIKNALGGKFNNIRTIMEVGCNDGCNLYPYHLNGFNVIGCDFDEVRMAPGRSKGMTMLKGGIEQLRKLSQTADLLIFSHVLEHLSDIDRALSEAKELLSSDGRIYIEVPGFKRWNRARSEAISDEWLVSGNNFLSYLQMEHNFCFEARTLNFFAFRNGLIAEKGDEFVRALYRRANCRDQFSTENKEYGYGVYNYILGVEKDYQKSNPLWKRFGRSIRNILRAGNG